MQRARLAFFVAIAVFAGIALSMSVLRAQGAEALVVRVANVGTHNAAVRVDVGSTAGDGYASWVYSLTPGSERSDRLDDPPRVQVSIRVTGEWSAPADDGRGAGRWVADARGCAGTLRVDFEMDTTIGVAFPRIDDACET